MVWSVMPVAGSIGDHHLRPGQGRPGDLVQQLDVAGDVEEELRLRRQRQVAGIPSQLAEGLRDRRPEFPPSRTCSTVSPASRSAAATRFEMVVLPLPSIPSKTTNI